MDPIPSILKGVDIFSVLGLEICEDTDPDETKKSLRRLFLKKAKRYHPDKRKKEDISDDKDDLEFVKLKAAFDFLQNDTNFFELFKKTLNDIRVKKRRLEKSKTIATKQATYLDALLKREKEVNERRSEQSPTGNRQDLKKDKNFQAQYDELFENFKNTPEPTQNIGELIVAARTLKVANESEINCILLSNHFHTLFDNYGLLRVEPLETIDTSQDRNIKVGKIVFESHEHAIRALLHYRNNKSKFRTDLYALALNPQSKSGAEKDDGVSLEAMERTILLKFRQAAEKRKATETVKSN